MAQGDVWILGPFGEVVEKTTQLPEYTRLQGPVSKVVVVAQLDSEFQGLASTCHAIPLLPDQYDELIATIIVISVILGVCFLVGLFIRTKLGQLIFNILENGVLSKAPGYKMVKETVNQFFGRKQSPFSSVALVQIFQNETKVTAFITDRHDNGIVTVFVPTGPNPTSGFIYHIPEEFVHPVNVRVEDAMRSVISCGTGSGMLIKELKK